MSDTPKAVFLSYAREDAEPARRIADALRAFGVEVWFDQAELRGGDSWDAKIKKQIRECALFMPMISAQTQERSEGYFRREWKLAVERMHDMAAGRAFIVPVVVDETGEADAAVPEEFMRVQWTRLVHGVPSPQFVEQIRELLGAPRRGAAAVRSMGPVVASRAGPAGAEAANTGAGYSRWIIGVLATAVIGLVAYVARRPAAREVAGAAPVTAPPAARARPMAALGEKSIAVLPFANLSAEKENEFFAVGVQDDILTDLAKIRDLTVVSRTSVRAYADTGTRNLKKIAEELGVATVLEGSVARVGQRVHMNAQLIDARTDAHLWADTFDGDASDIFVLQASVAQKIAAALRVTLTGSERALIERRPTHDQEAYDLYVRARALHQEQGESGTLKDFEKVVAVYERAIEKDPGFALAHAQVALVHSVMYWFAFLDPTPARAARMKQEVDAAVRLAPDAPETHLAIGAYLYRVKLDWKGALAEFRRAEPALPNDDQLSFWLAISQRRLGLWQGSVAAFEHAFALNPRDLAIATNHSEFLLYLRRWDEAAEAATRVRAYFPEVRVSGSNAALVKFARDGDRAAFARAIEGLPAGEEAERVLNLFLAAMVRGDLAAADRALANPRIVSVPSPNNAISDPPSLHRAALAFLRGDRDAAARYGEEAADYFIRTPWNARQAPWVHMRMAEISAWRGSGEVAVTMARAAYAEMLAQDAFDATNVRPLLGAVLIATGRHEEAIACLREMMSGPCALSPNEIRIDPFWSRLKDDPRFEEILKSAKPL